MALSKEELAELNALEAEERQRLSDEADAIARQHIAALKLTKKLAASHGKPGHDFVVLETTAGNLAVKRPRDVDVDAFTEEEDGRESTEKFARSLLIDPPTDLDMLIAQNAGLAPAVVRAANDLLKVIRTEEAKK